MFCRKTNKIGSMNPLLINQPPRTNGWKWPPHPCQLISGVVYLFYMVAMLGTLIPLLPSWWLAIGNTCTSIALYGHLVFYVLATSIDTSDDNVLTKKYNGSIRAFGHKKFKRDLENRHCFICDVNVGSKSVHCSRCNKCVAEFDHHSIWLNNCVGRRNYWYYLSTIITGIFLHLLVVCFSSIVLVAYFVDRKWLRSNPMFATISDARTWIALLLVDPVYITSAVFLTITVITSGVSVLVLVYLIYLLRHNIYILWKRTGIYKCKMRRCEHMPSTDCPIAMEEGQLTSQSVEKVAGDRYAEFTRTTLLFECNALTESATTDTSQNLQNCDVKPSTSKMANDPVPTISAMVQQSHEKKALKINKKKHREPTDTFSFSSLVRSTRSPAVHPQSEKVWKRTGIYKYLPRWCKKMQSTIIPIEMEEGKLPSRSVEARAFAIIRRDVKNV